MLSSGPGRVKSAVTELMDTMKTYPHFVLSTGCDLPQAVPLENLSAFMEAGRETRWRSASLLSSTFLFFCLDKYFRGDRKIRMCQHLTNIAG